MNHLAARLASSCSYHCQFRIQKTHTRQPPWHDLEKKLKTEAKGRPFTLASISSIYLLPAKKKKVRTNRFPDMVTQCSLDKHVRVQKRALRARKPLQETSSGLF